MTRSQISLELKISSETIRYYESIGLIKPKRDSTSGYRIYSYKDIEKIEIIILLKKFGYKLKDIKLFFDMVNNGIKNKTELNYFLTDQIKAVEKKIEKQKSILNLLIDFKEKKDVKSCNLFSKILEES